MSQKVITATDSKVINSIQPRPYQLEALEAIFSRQKERISKQLISLPTGTGKTIIFGLLAKELNVRALIIAHREQLIKQAVEKVCLVWPDASIGVCMGERNELDAQIVVASIQSASRFNRLEQLKDQDFQLCIIDEAHHAAADSYRNLLSQLGFLDGDSSKLLVGVTATPSRKDAGLGDIFQQVVFERSIGTMIKAGYLADLKGKRILTSTNLNGVSTNMGDFVEYQLAEVCNTPERNALIADSFLEHCPERKAIAFTCDIQHAIDLADMFKSRGISAAPISGNMSDEEKESLLSRFACGDIQVLANCALLTEGFDQPDITAVLMCRPTRSQPLYIQCVGRGTRLHPGKSDCLVMDFCDNFHSIQTLTTLEKAISLPIEPKTPQEGYEGVCGEENAPRTVFVGQQIIGDFDLLDRSKFAWTPIKEHWHLQLSPNLAIWLKKDTENLFVPTLQSEEHFEQLVSRPIPLDYAMGLAEDWVRRNENYQSWSVKNAKWREEEPSEKQIETLVKLGIDPEGLTKGQATQLIGQKINEKNLWRYEPASSKQRYFLRYRGVNISSDISKGEAARLISQVKEKAG